MELDPLRRLRTEIGCWKIEGRIEFRRYVGGFVTLGAVNDGGNGCRESQRHLDRNEASIMSFVKAKGKRCCNYSSAR